MSVEVPLFIEPFAKVKGDKSQFCAGECPYVVFGRVGVTHCKLFDERLKFDSHADENNRLRRCIFAEDSHKFYFPERKQ